MTTLKAVRDRALAREAEIAGMPDGPDKRAMRRVGRLIGAGERLALDYEAMKAGKPLAPSRLRRLIGA